MKREQHDIKAYQRHGSQATGILNCDLKHRLAVSITLRPFYPGGEIEGLISFGTCLTDRQEKNTTTKAYNDFSGVSQPD
jgi:hypothetical protein